MRRIRAAVVGIGFIGPAHVEALRRLPGIDVVAVCSRNREKVNTLAEKFGIPRIYTDWHRLIEDEDIDVIHNCTPNYLHFEINKTSILAGKHVVSEKPLTIESKQSSELLRLVRTRPVVNAINFNYRFYPLVQQAREIVRSGDLGEVYLVHGNYLQDWLFFDTDYNWRLETRLSGASRAVADIGSHWCDLVQFVTGLRIQRVCADLATVHKIRKRPGGPVETFRGKEKKAPLRFERVRINTEDAGNILLKFGNGARGVFTVSQVSAGRKNHEWFEIDGSKKALAWNQEEPNQLWIGHREKPNSVMIKDPSLLGASVRKYAHYPGGHPEGYPDGPKNLFMNVYDFIRSGKDPRGAKPDFPTFEDGHWENKVVEAILKSDTQQRWVDV